MLGCGGLNSAFRCPWWDSAPLVVKAGIISGACARNVGGKSLSPANFSEFAFPLMRLHCSLHLCFRCQYLVAVCAFINLPLWAQRCQLAIADNLVLDQVGMQRWWWWCGLTSQPGSCCCCYTWLKWRPLVNVSGTLPLAVQTSYTRPSCQSFVRLSVTVSSCL